jgi:hypothetical protein
VLLLSNRAVFFVDLVHHDDVRGCRQKAKRSAPGSQPLARRFADWMDRPGCVDAHEIVAVFGHWPHFT